jgi:hypothetical protein
LWSLHAVKGREDIQILDEENRYDRGDRNGNSFESEFEQSDRLDGFTARFPLMWLPKQKSRLQRTWAFGWWWPALHIDLLFRVKRFQFIENVRCKHVSSARFDDRKRHHRERHAEDIAGVDVIFGAAAATWSAQLMATILLSAL